MGFDLSRFRSFGMSIEWDSVFRVPSYGIRSFEFRSYGEDPKNSVGIISEVLHDSMFRPCTLVANVKSASGDELYLYYCERDERLTSSHVSRSYLMWQ